jgi:hypothetical protein
MFSQKRNHIKPSDMEFTVDPGMRWGEMPKETLMAKFEETYLGDIATDEMVNDAIRKEIVDRRVDPVLFEHEQPRGRVNERAGVLQLHYYGKRGEEEAERPEIFLGFGGYEDIDPRGINVDPNMEKFTDQANARMRYQRFDPDMSEQITGLGRSESQQVADRQKMDNAVRQRLKIFDIQRDGRKNGMRRTFAKRPTKDKQVTTEGYGDKIKDYALYPQRPANIIHGRPNRHAFSDPSYDQDLAFATYTQSCRRAKTATSESKTHGAAERADGGFAEGDKTASYRTAARLIESLAAERRGRQLAQDMTTDAAIEERNKRQRVLADISVILHESRAEGLFQEGDITMMMKNPEPMNRAHQALQVVTDGFIPAHHYLNAEAIRKSAALKDMSRAKHEVITDGTVDGDEDTARAVKAAKRGAGGDLRREMTADIVDVDELQFASFKRRDKRGARAGIGGATEDFAAESDIARARQTQKKIATTVNKNNLVQGAAFKDSAHQDRHLAPLGSKNMRGFMDRESRTGTGGIGL